MEWMKVSERLPELNKLVALIDARKCQNDPNCLCPPARIGHLDEFGGKYWSCYGERATVVEGYTHWCYLPDLPKEFNDKWADED